jgi:cyclopropane fatty-acyl-phospholipid synthase-like methyltransferase
LSHEGSAPEGAGFSWFFLFSGGGVVQNGFCQEIATTAYWDGNARRHKLWVDHSGYHRQIISFLMERVQPHWRVLDIGAGDGALTLPLSARGCKVTALEPSAEMRRLLFARAESKKTANFDMCDCSWDSFSDKREFDLILACNTLHLIGGIPAFDRILQMNPKNVLVVHEGRFSLQELHSHAENHTLTEVKQSIVNSPYVYHSYSEALEHFRFRSGGWPDHAADEHFRTVLRHRDGHYWIDDEVEVAMLWWRRNDC